MESNRSLRLMWIALVLGMMEFNFSTEGARLRKPTPISSTSWQRQVFGSRFNERFIIISGSKFSAILLQDRHANRKRIIKQDISHVLQTVNQNVSKDGLEICATFPFVKEVKLSQRTNSNNKFTLGDLNVKCFCPPLIGCDPLNGHCKVPGECRCRIGLDLIHFFK